MSGTPVLELHHLDVRFGEQRLLQDINAEVQPAEFVGCIGPNGAGKTTLLRVILGLQLPTHGKVRISGLPARQGHRLIGYVPQKIHFDPDIPLRGRDLVGLGLDGHRWGLPLPSRARRERIESALAEVDALSFADKPIGRLSGGEQQRLMIAQALLTDPQILLLDEPLSNLDIRSSHEVVQCVARIGKANNIAVILVAHDMNPLLPVMDRILYLAHGQAAMGPVADVIQSEVLSRLYGYTVEVLRLKGRILIVGGAETELADGDFSIGTQRLGEESLAP